VVFVIEGRGVSYPSSPTQFVHPIVPYAFWNRIRVSCHTVEAFAFHEVDFPPTCMIRWFWKSRSALMTYSRASFGEKRFGVDDSRKRREETWFYTSSYSAFVSVGHPIVPYAF
jgi:hypothetical protein